LNLFGTDISDANFAIITDKIHSPETAVARRGGAKLGIGTRDLNSCVISTVQPGSAAEKAGIQFNDEITSFDGQPVQTFSDLTDLIARKNPSETVSLEIRRNGDTIQKTISLGQWN
jgi:S1-C subfamily serine protease